MSKPLAPPPLSPPIRIAVLGRDRAGKTTLCHQILSAWGSPRPPATPSRPPPKPYPSRLSVAISRFLSFLSNFHPFSRGTSADIHALPQGGLLVDRASGDTTAAVAQALDFRADVILFVTRLDDARVSRRDRMRLLHMIQYFGEEALQKTVFVLTHGAATPPADLTYRDFVRGRTDWLWRSVEEMLPPLLVPEEERVGSEGAREDLGAGEEEEEEAEEDVIDVGDASDGEAAAANSNAGEEPPAVAAGASEEDEGAERTRRNGQDDMFRIRPDILDSMFGEINVDDMSMPSMEEDVVENICKHIIDPDDDRVFKERFKPPVVLVELSESCPRDENGEKVLPDGTVWLSKFLNKVTSVAAETRRREQEQLESLALVSGSRVHMPQGFLAQMGVMLKQLRKDFLRLVLAEIAIALLVVQIGREVREHEERMRQKERDETDDDDDVLLTMSDEEYEALTRPSDSKEPYVLFDRMPKEHQGEGEEFEREFSNDEGSKLSIDDLEDEKTYKE